METKNHLLRGVVFIVLSFLVVGVTGAGFTKMRNLEPLVKGPGVTLAAKLSDYSPGLAGTPGDTEVYILGGKEPGGTMMVLGATHGIEPSGIVTSTLLIENAVLPKGRLIILPHANRSGLTWNEPGQGHPEQFTIKTREGGTRWFRFGARHTNPADQWPDMEVYIHYPSGQILSGEETRNLNRAYPGRPDGTLTEKIAFGICELIRKEKVDIGIDIHEAPPEKPLINALCAHERAASVAGLAIMNLEMDGMKMRLEISPKDLRGLSHREWGDHTKTLAILIETPNASQGGMRGVTTPELVTVGKDPFYVWAAKLRRLFVSYDEKGHPMEERVGKDVASIAALAAAFSEMHPDKPLTIEGIPTAPDIAKNGVGYYLKTIPQ